MAMLEQMLLVKKEVSYRKLPCSSKHYLSRRKQVSEDFCIWNYFIIFLFLFRKQYAEIMYDEIV